MLGTAELVLPNRLTGGLGREVFRSFCMYMYRTSRNNLRTLGNKVPGQSATFTHFYLVGGREASPSGVCQRWNTASFDCPHAFWKVGGIAPLRR